MWTLLDNLIWNKIYMCSVIFIITDSIGRQSNSQISETNKPVINSNGSITEVSQTCRIAVDKARMVGQRVDLTVKNTCVDFAGVVIPRSNC